MNWNTIRLMEMITVGIAEDPLAGARVPRVLTKTSWL